jgi:hypothetical protein
LAVPVHPLVFDSLMMPIQQDWLKKRDLPNQREDFWLYRRTRPLGSYVPVSPGHQLAMVRGWMTARVLGHVAARPGQGAVSIWTPRGLRSFPPVLLSRAATLDVTLPALFEALPLAMLSYSANDCSEVEAYERLMQLGSSPGEAATAGYPELNEELAAWILDGTRTNASPSFPDAPLPNEQDAGSAGDDPAQRARLVRESVDAVAEIYRGLAGQAITTETSLTMDRRWELRDLYLEATAQLGAALAAHEATYQPRKRGVG